MSKPLQGEIALVTGAGRAFCAGMDLATEGDNVFGLDGAKRPTLADMADLDDPGIARIRDTGGRVTLAIYACRKPVIAAVNGAAVGIGATMTAAMDIRLASSAARKRAANAAFSLSMGPKARQAALSI